jgi:transcriptional regulator with XRE-family HTH domain
MELLLRHWREKRGYSVRQLGERAGVGYATVSKIENGRMSPTVALLEKLARALEISVRELFPVERSSSEPRTRR